MPRFSGSRPEAAANAVVTSRGRRTVGRIGQAIPDSITKNEALAAAIRLLPSNYNFEIEKTVWNIQKNNAKRVALQMPEGLLMYSLIISDIISEFTSAETLVMGDVLYGACCIDDYTARKLGCDFLVHYAHSCLVPVDVTEMKVLYVFVTIAIDEPHMEATIRKNFPAGSRLAVFGTIQFNPSIHNLVARLLDYVVTPPQIMPLSKGEVLGCTSQRLGDTVDAMVYVGDGRFHLELAMIHNPHIPAYRYDPYSRKFTRERYHQEEMVKVRREAVDTARRASTIGLVLGALGRQGSPVTAEKLEQALRNKGYTVVRIVLSEILPGKIALFDGIDAFVQVACPRLLIDWGYAFPQPLLTPYEAMVLVEEDVWMEDGSYPMDYYGKDGYGRGKVPARGAA